MDGRRTVTHLASLEAGLDALETHDVKEVSAVRRVLSGVWPPALFFGLFLLVWELAYRAELKPTYALPSPADVFLEDVEASGGAP